MDFTDTKQLLEWTWVGGAAGLSAAVLTAHRLVERRIALRDRKGRTQLDDLESLGDAAPVSLHPEIDPLRCIGSGACIRACPEHDVINIVDGRARLVNPLACVGHGACAAACGVEAIRLAFGTATRGVELPKVDERFETPASGVFVVGELSGMGLIRNAVRQGVLAGSTIGKRARSRCDDTLDAVVVGAGPAGIGAALALREAGARYVLLEREQLGGTIMHYPRGKVVMAGELALPGYGRVDKSRMSKEDLVSLWRDIQIKTDLQIETNTLVSGIAREPDGAWRIDTARGVKRAFHVVLALGRRGAPRKLDVAGEEQAKVSYRVIEPDEHAGKHVMVVGGGNSAVETALVLADFKGCASVSISYRRDRFARARAENLQRIEQALKTGVVRGYLGTELLSIGTDSVQLRFADGREEQVPNDAVVVQAGGTEPGALLAQFGVKTETKFGEL